MITAGLLTTPVLGQEKRGVALFEQAQPYEQAGDLERAAKLYEEAARLGHLGAKVHLGYLCQIGVGTPRDTARALRLFEEAAQAGDRDGQFLLGMTYLSGIGLAKDPGQARPWLARAADGGHQAAQLTTGSMLLEGTGGPQNAIAAGRWFARAAQGPDQQLAERAAKLRDVVIALASHSENETRLESMLAGLAAVWAVTLATAGSQDSESPPSGRGSHGLCFGQCLSLHQALSDPNAYSNCHRICGD
jgi:lipopolysaccharide biosynthesis regulator YciM